MKFRLIVALLPIFLFGCHHSKPPKQAPDLSPPLIDLRKYECHVGDWCPSEEDVRWILVSVDTCHHNKYVAKTGVRAPQIPLVDWRIVIVKNECSASWDDAGRTIYIYAGRNCSYTQGKTAQQMQRIIKRAIGHAEHHNCLPDGNHAHCQEGCGGWACQEWCECLTEVGF